MNAWLGAWISDDIMGYGEAIRSMTGLNQTVRGYSSWDDFLQGLQGEEGGGVTGAVGTGTRLITDYAAPGLLDQLGLGPQDDVVTPPPAVTTPTGQVVVQGPSTTAAAGLGAAGLIGIGVVAYLLMAGKGS